MPRGVLMPTARATYATCCLSLTLADYTRMGVFVLGGGKGADGASTVPDGWFAEAGSPAAKFGGGFGYGYQWWNQKVGDYMVLFAWGHGGQYIMMIPELDAVVVFTSSVTSESRRPTYKRPIFELLENDILPFLEK